MSCFNCLVFHVAQWATWNCFKCHNNKHQFLLHFEPVAIKSFSSVRWSFSSVLIKSDFHVSTATTFTPQEKNPVTLVLFLVYLSFLIQFFSVYSFLMWSLIRRSIIQWEILLRYLQSLVDCASDFPWRLSWIIFF